MLLPDKKVSVFQGKHLQLVSELMDGLRKVNTVWKGLKQTQDRRGWEILAFLKT